jgi:hypothetical protein
MDMIAAGGPLHMSIGMTFVFIAGVVLGAYLSIYHNTIDRIRSWFVCPVLD